MYGFSHTPHVRRERRDSLYVKSLHWVSCYWIQSRHRSPKCRVLSRSLIPSIEIPIMHPPILDPLQNPRHPSGRTPLWPLAPCQGTIKSRFILSNLPYLVQDLTAFCVPRFFLKCPALSSLDRALFDVRGKLVKLRGREFMQSLEETVYDVDEETVEEFCCNCGTGLSIKQARGEEGGGS
jgi:hypothetical protein